MVILCLTEKTNLTMPEHSDISVTVICLDSRSLKPQSSVSRFRLPTLQGLTSWASG